MVQRYKGYFSKSWRVTEHKFLEIETNYDNSTWFWINCHWTRHQDHAGIRLNFNVAGFEVDVTFYDHRHWDYDNDCFFNSDTKRKQWDLT